MIDPRNAVEQAEPAARLNPEVSPEVSAIIQRLMAKDPGDRYQTANELIEERAVLLQPPQKRGLGIGLAAAAVALAATSTSPAPWLGSPAVCVGNPAAGQAGCNGHGVCWVLTALASRPNPYLAIITPSQYEITPTPGNK